VTPFQLRCNTTGKINVFVGCGAGSWNESGEKDTYVGYNAGGSARGSENTCLGYEAGMYGLGDRNTSIGYHTGSANYWGSGNVFLGYEAGGHEVGSDKLYIANGPEAEDVLVYGDFATGYLGLGTLSPERKLHVAGAGPRILIDASSGSPEVNFKTAGDPASEVWAIYKHSIEEDLRFYQNGDRVTFENGTGNVAIGTTDPAGYRLYVNGTAYATGGWQPSDLRLKTDVHGIEDALGKVLKLNGVTFRWRTEEHADRGFPQGRHYGLVAQEVEQVLPETVNNGPDGEKALAYSEIIPVLVESIKELKAENDALKHRVDALESEISMVPAAAQHP
jgi:hypothetical protein